MLTIDIADISVYESVNSLIVTVTLIEAPDLMDTVTVDWDTIVDTQAIVTLIDDNAKAIWESSVKKAKVARG